MGAKQLGSILLVLLLAGAGGWVLLHRQNAAPPALPAAPAAQPAAPQAAPTPPATADKPAGITIYAAEQHRAPENCLVPGPIPVLPNGATATQADMHLGREVIQHFVVELEAYQACRNAQADFAAPGVPQKQKDSWIADGNAAVDAANQLAAAYANQLKIFKARGAPAQ